MHCRPPSCPVSEVLPDLDLEQLSTFLEIDGQARAVKAYRAALRGH